MLFLQKIDNRFEKTCSQYLVSSKNDDFYIYIPIDIYNNTHRFQAVIRKGKKSKLLILSGKQRVYLTDDQIITTILSMSGREIEWFLTQFISLYVGNGAQTTFVLDGEEFTYTGIHSYPERKEILLLSDTNIELSYFCFLLNFIFAKDMCWEEMSGTLNFSKKTLCKYISIIDYYYNTSAYSRAFLKKLDYPIEQVQPSRYISAKKAFEKDDCVEKFDISNYI